MRAVLAACHGLAMDYNIVPLVLYVFRHKTQYALIHAPYTHIVVFWHIGNIPLVISKSQIYYNTSTFGIVVIFVKYCYTASSWLL